ncbi:hypothetical protein SteCoe_7349 [Stentor coeruleus]|uniref:Uncharacterized protein n=1 Tax=Stentor coeruleus TaxID=5963 RepID=A0A1R2CMT0_9CILI|nr:hypothetical protein SteCoe_7349 [Stentor coeruleus]
MLQMPRKLQYSSALHPNNPSLQIIPKKIINPSEQVLLKHPDTSKFISIIRERNLKTRLVVDKNHKQDKTPKKFRPFTPDKKSLFLNSNTNKKLLTHNNYKGDVPPVGLYNIENSWIKKSFSNKALSIIVPILPSTSTPRSQTPVITTQVSSRKCKKVFQTKISALAPRKKGIWERLKVYNTPEQIGTILSFKSLKQDISARQMNISQSLERLKEEYFL